MPSGTGKPTRRQQEVYDTIVSFHRLRGYYPSVRELMLRLDVRSTSTVYQFLKALRRKGLLRSVGRQGIIRADGVRVEPEKISAVLVFCRETIEAYRRLRRQGFNPMAAERKALADVERSLLESATVDPARAPEEALT